MYPESECSGAIRVVQIMSFVHDCRSLNVYSGVKGYPELQCLSIASQTPTLESIVMSPDFFDYQVKSLRLPFFNA